MKVPPTSILNSFDLGVRLRASLSIKNSCSLSMISMGASGFTCAEAGSTLTGSGTVDAAVDGINDGAGGMSGLKPQSMHHPKAL